MIGNGMRATIWKDFIERFKIKEMIEVYGITEGNVGVCKLFYSGNYKYETYLNNMLLHYIKQSSKIMSPYAFMVCTDTTIPLFYFLHSSITT
jgi:hypothetical protein